MQDQRTIRPHLLVYTVDGRPVTDYLRQQDPVPIQRLIGEVDGHRVVWARTGQHYCAEHQRGAWKATCSCPAALHVLAAPQALHDWHDQLSRPDRRALRQATRQGRRAPAWWDALRLEVGFALNGNRLILLTAVVGAVLLALTLR